jgi:hypothetical protein
MRFLGNWSSAQRQSDDKIALHGIADASEDMRQPCGVNMQYLTLPYLSVLRCELTASTTMCTCMTQHQFWSVTCGS